MLYPDTLKAIRIIEQTTKPINNGLSEVHHAAMKKNAEACSYFQTSAQNHARKSCLYCAYLDTRVYSCGKLNKPVIPYEWI